MSLLPIMFRSLRPSSWIEQQLKMMQHLESAMSSSFPRHPAWHVEWQIPEEEAKLMKHAEAVVKSNKPFKVQMDVKNFTPQEISVKAIDGNIIVEGKHEESSDDKGFVSRHFVRTYNLPAGHFVEDVVSCLENGVLTISAPNRAVEEPVVKEIPIDVKKVEEGSSKS